MKKLIYVASPYAGDPEKLKFAQRCCRYVMDQGHAPFAPHVAYGTFLDESTDRKLGMDCGKAYLAKCDEVWLFTSHGISDGMLEEMQFARDNGITITNKGGLTK